MIWLIVMALFIAALAGPVARQFGWSYGRFGRLGDMLVVVVGAILGSVILTAIFSAVGFQAGGDNGALIGGFVGAMIAVVLMVLFGAASASAEPNRAGEADPAGPTPPGNQPPGPDGAPVNTPSEDRL
ncbi:MAG: GlsB/YeaQ/YmgE family stress response membrane protein [Chloroflexi bacterium]|nr:GlsB/YeaQ/YmgE family stress response membrane protein [Chloroflexota bacterium]